MSDHSTASIITTEHLKVGLKVRNIKSGNTYIIQSFGHHSETLDYLVHYQSESHGDNWFRPLGLFMLKFELA